MLSSSSWNDCSSFGTTRDRSFVPYTAGEIRFLLPLAGLDPMSSIEDNLDPILKGEEEADVEERPPRRPIMSIFDSGSDILSSSVRSQSFLCTRLMGLTMNQFSKVQPARTRLRPGSLRSSRLVISEQVWEDILQALRSF